MRKILIIGSGKSTSYLIKYLLEQSVSENLFIIIGDIHLESAKKLINNHKNAKAIQLDVFDKKARVEALKNADIIISMLPARFHIEIAKDCIFLNKHLVTASYVSSEMQSLNDQVKAKGLIFMNEIGVDPGLDHMSALAIIHRIRDQGGQIILFETYTGGLVAPESDNNLWNYKFTWNPRNVVLAGQGSAAKFIQEGHFKYIPYHRLFQCTKLLNIKNLGQFEVYANRDALKYQNIYGLDAVKTLYRGTIRRAGFSKAWDIFVSLGMTDDSYIIENSRNMSYRDFINAFLPYSNTDAVELKLKKYLKCDEDDMIWKKLIELDILNPHKFVNLEKATPAEILLKILIDHWKLAEHDKDMIVMYHKIGYEWQGKKHQINANMVTIGENSTYTAMSKTVGLPVAISALGILNGKITTPGVQIPTTKEVYQPILDELKHYGIVFNEKMVPYQGHVTSNI